MTPKEYLMQYRINMQKMESDANRIRRLREIAEDLGAGKNLSQAVENLVDAEKAATRNSDRLRRSSSEIITLLDDVPWRYSQLLRLQYIDGLSLAQAADAYIRDDGGKGISYRHAARLNGQALKEVAQRIP